MVKYSEEIEKQVLKLFEDNTLVTTDMIAENVKITPATVLNRLMDNGVISRCSDPLYVKQYLYFLCSKKNEVENELKIRKKQSIRKKHKEVQNKIIRVERGRAYHLELIKKYDKELAELREKLKFLTFLISPE